MKPITLNNWYVPDIEPFQAPEVKHYLYLIGTRSTDNVRVITSHVISTKGRIVRTNSGTLYFLGTVEKEYLDWMNEHNIDFDINNPVKIKGI